MILEADINSKEQIEIREKRLGLSTMLTPFRVQKYLAYLYKIRISMFDLLYEITLKFYVYI